MSKPRPALLGVAAIVVAAALAYRLLVPAGDHRAESGASDTPVDAARMLEVAPAPAHEAPAAKRPSARDRSDTAPPAPRQPLPPKDTPIAQVYDNLAARARAGDAAASCRLGQDLDRCAIYPTLRWQLQEEAELREAQRKRGVSEKQLDQDMQIGAARRLAVEKIQALCAGLSEARVAEGFDWLLLAADQGSVAAASRFATRVPFDPAHTFEHLDRLMVYRDHAAELAQRALAGGDLAIVGPLAEAYNTPPDQPYRELLAQLVPPDPVEGYALLRLQAMLGAPGTERRQYQLDQLAGRLTPAQRAAAEARATSLRNGPYGNAPAQALAATPERPFVEIVQQDYCEGDR